MTKKTVKNIIFEMWDNINGYFSKNSEEELLLNKISPNKIPQHVAIIMDGNGRWAKMKNLSRIEGHKKGGEIAQEITEVSARIGILYLTLYTFSTENWKRPAKEIGFLFKTLYTTLEKNKEILVKNEIRLNIFGESDKIPLKLIKMLTNISELTKNNSRMQLNLAFNYGSRSEIVHAVREIVKKKVPLNKINQELFSKYLFTKDIPDPDLIIRTSGEFRLSNFMLYQMAYSELYFSKVLWPDFTSKDYLEAILDYQMRKRRYGTI